MSKDFLTPDQYCPNRWKLESADGTLIAYFTTEEAALNAYATCDDGGLAASLYSCMEDGEGGLSEWERENWNCDLDTGKYDKGDDEEDDDLNYTPALEGHRIGWAGRNLPSPTPTT